MKELGSGTRKVVDQSFQTHNRIPKIFMETGNTELIKQLVMQGEGVSSGPCRRGPGDLPEDAGDRRTGRPSTGFGRRYRPFT